MSKLLDQAVEELKLLPADAQRAITHDLIEMIESERKWDALFADPRSKNLLARLAAEAEADEVFDFDPATPPASKSVL